MSASSPSNPGASRACAKFILLGEHSVLHGGQALAFPIPELKLTVAHSSQNNGPSLNGKKLASWQSDKVAEVLRSMEIDVKPSALEITSEIPIGKGLGSSAALCVALARHFFPNYDEQRVAKTAMKGEAYLHGSSSGVDPFTIAIERPIAYRMENFEFRPMNLSGNDSHVFLLRDSGMEHATSSVLTKVAELKAANPTHFQSIIDRLKVNTNLGLKFLESEEFDRLGLLLQDSNRLLFELGLGNDANLKAIESLLKEGALGAKITGAGLGGYVFGLFPDYKVPKNLRDGDIIVRCSGS